MTGCHELKQAYDLRVMSTVYGLVQPSSLTSGAEGFFFCKIRASGKGKQGTPPREGIIKKKPAATS